jgi:predicted MFS family arabinose efflux permease
VSQDASPWAPLRIRAFRALWVASLVSLTGIWFQTVGAQWLLIDEPDASVLVALVQTATAAPFVFFALVGGVLADTLDRRWLLIAVQSAAAAIGALLAVLAFSDALPPALLLVLIFALGSALALTTPTYQSLVPDLVPRQQVPAAAALNSISVNVGRAIGPAIGGILIAQAGVGATFAAAAATAACYAIAAAFWRPPPTRRANPEPFVAAMRAGGRYVRHAPVVRRIMLRAALFLVPASALFALLPLVASERLGLGADGYGLLLAAIGAGAIVGALVLPRVRARLSINQMITGAGGVFVLALAVIALLRDVVPALLVLLAAGVAWVVVLSSVNAALVLFLPGWVRGRSLALYQAVLFGSQAVSGLLAGPLANAVGLVDALLIAAATVAIGAVTIRVWPFIDTREMDRAPVEFWPAPQLAPDVDPAGRPVVVTVTYRVRADDEPRFLAAMSRIRESRLRTGAIKWALYRDGEDGHAFVELFAVASWEEHERQHRERLTETDHAIEERAEQLALAPSATRHLIAVDVDRMT